jgi:hypothetical protein
MTAANISAYLPTGVSPDYASSLSVCPESAIVEIATGDDKILTGYDETEERISFQDNPEFYVLLSWKKLSESDAGTLFDWYMDTAKADGTVRSFQWTHPTDLTSYVVRFASDISRTIHRGIINDFAEIRLKILGIPPVPASWDNVKSVILDIADNYGHASGWTSVRQVDFYDSDGNKISLAPTTDYVAYASSCWDSCETSGGYSVYNAFNTSKAYTGGWSTTSWLTGTAANHRLICVFNEVKTLTKIRVNNGHDSGVAASTLAGAENTKIYFSTDAITDTTYNAVIANSLKIFDDALTQHAASDAEDGQDITP